MYYSRLNREPGSRRPSVARLVHAGVSCPRFTPTTELPRIVTSGLRVFETTVFVRSGPFYTQVIRKPIRSELYVIHNDFEQTHTKDPGPPSKNLSKSFTQYPVVQDGSISN